MSVIGSNILAGASGQGGDYTIARSLRFRSSASAYLNRTPASVTDRQKFTWSGWVKRGSLGIYGQLFSARDSDNNNFGLLFWNDDALYFADQTAPTYNLQFKTTQVFRDPSAWYHIVLAIDTTQATNTNRVKLYVNGSQVTAFSTATYPTQNLNTYVNTANAHNIGAFTANSNHFDGYITELNFIDGQALSPSSFGATNASTGVWQPKKYAGTYGTNGFYLPFSDNASTTTLGNDFSGNGNNWTTNNISLTAGSTYDSMTDVPTLTSATASNFCVLNPILQNGWWAAPSRGAISNGNLRLSQNNGTAFSTFDVNTSGKWYCELTITSYGQTSAQSEIIVSAKSRSTFEVSYYQGGNKSVNNSVTGYGSSWTTGDVIGIAIDQTGNQVTFYKNGVSQGAISNTFPSETVLVGYYAEGTGTDTIDYNFGQRPFAYTPPTGFVALNTFNLPTPTIGATASTQANKYFDIKLYTGNGGGSNTQTISGLGFSPDLVWIKSRSAAIQSNIFDTVRGATKGLISSSTSDEITDAQSLTSFNSDGFTLGSSTISLAPNYPSETYVAWNWDANGAGSSNTAGSITSTVSANTSAGFSVVTYTGTGANATVGHGLGVAPKMVIVKCRNNAEDWATYHVGLTSAAYVVLLNSTQGQTNSPTNFNSTAPTSTVFSVGTAGNTNANTQTYVAYCFAEVAGYSAFGKYTGNGSTDGTFVYTGFRPKFVMIKATNDISHWTIEDGTRSPYNVATASLYADTSGAESNSIMSLDLLSNGFKCRNVLANESNVNGYTYVYMAFAENPFKYSLAR